MVKYQIVIHGQIISETTIEKASIRSDLCSLVSFSHPARAPLNRRTMPYHWSRRSLSAAPSDIAACCVAVTHSCQRRTVLNQSATNLSAVKRRAFSRA